MIKNVEADKVKEWLDVDASPTPILKQTMGNRGRSETEYDDNDMVVQVYLNYAVIVIILVLVNLLRWRQLYVEKVIDEKNITPADFT